MLLPYTSDRPPRNPPLAVVSLVLLQFVIFGVIAIMLAIPSMRSQVVGAYVSLSLVPSAIRWYAPFTYSFLHEDVFHLSVNMLFLWVFGGSVEDAIGRKRFVALYLVAAVLTGLLEALMVRLLAGPDTLVQIVGASGTISALVGVFAVRFYRSRIRFVGLPWRVPAVGLLAAVLLWEMAAAIMEITRPGDSGPVGIAHWAHIGGFLLGMSWAYLSRQFQAGSHEYMAGEAEHELKSGSPLSAVRRWEAVLLTHPNDTRALAELGRAWGVVGDREQCDDCYKRAITDYLKLADRPSATARYLEWIAFYADSCLDVKSQFEVAVALEDQGDYTHAGDAFGSIVCAYPDASEAEISELRAAVICIKRLQKVNNGIEALKTFLERYPNSEWRVYAEGIINSPDTDTPNV